jgi:hypothetical protein
MMMTTKPTPASPALPHIGTPEPFTKLGSGPKLEVNRLRGRAVSRAPQ